MSATEQHPQGHGEFKYPAEPFQQALNYWTEAARTPARVLTPNRHQYGTAFGNGAILLGSDNTLSQEIRNRLNEGKTTIAGVEFSGTELTWIGQYYDRLGKKLDAKGRCMDERIDETKGTSGIHTECGAAGAIGAVIGKTGTEVEDIAVGLTHEDHKAGLIDGMKHHEAVTVMVTFGPQPYSLDTAKYGEARENAALPFHTFIDVQEVDAYAKEQGVNRVDVFKALMKWNPQIAINIMTGTHNHYRDVVAEKGVIALLDTRGVDKAQYADMTSAMDEFFAGQKVAVRQVEIKS